MRDVAKLQTVSKLRRVSHRSFPGVRGSRKQKARGRGAMARESVRTGDGEAAETASRKSNQKTKS